MCSRSYKHDRFKYQRRLFIVSCPAPRAEGKGGQCSERYTKAGAISWNFADITQAIPKPGCIHADRVVHAAEGRERVRWMHLGVKGVKTCKVAPLCRTS